MRSNEIRITPLHRGAFALVLGTAVLCGQSYSGLRGDLTVLQVDPHHRGTLIGGTATAQLFRSRDGGETWDSIQFPGALHAALHAIVIDPGKPDVYLVAVSSETQQFAGVFRTTDAGATWRPIAGLEQRQVWALVRWRTDPKVIAAGTQEGVFLSRDGGDSWTLLSSSHSDWPKPVMSIAFDPTSLNTIYAGTPHLAWKTKDGGNTWVRLTRGMREDSDIFAIDVDGAQRTNLFAAACSGLYSSQGRRCYLVQYGSRRRRIAPHLRCRARAKPFQHGVRGDQRWLDQVDGWRRDVASSFDGCRPFHRLRSNRSEYDLRRH